MEMKRRIVLMSINPEFVAKISSGEKTVELRKRFPRFVDFIVVYETAPTSRIVGIIDVKKIVESSVDLVWNFYKRKTGIDEERYRKYFSGKKYAIAIEIEKYTNLAQPIPIGNFGFSHPPQSYCYLSCSKFFEAFSK